MTGPGDVPAKPPYRDSLEAARQRVAQLEEALADRPGGRAPRPRARAVSAARLAVLVVAAVPALALGSLAVVTRDLHRGAFVPAITVVTPARVPDELGPGPVLDWYGADGTTPVAHHGPWVHRGKNGPALIGMLWRRGAYEDGLHVVAFDRETLTPRWKTPALPGLRGDGSERHRLLVVADEVFLSDAAGTIRVFSAHTGKAYEVLTLPPGVLGACIEGRGAHRILFGEGAYLDAERIRAMPPWQQARVQTYAFDRQTRKLSPASLIHPDGAAACQPAPACATGMRNGCRVTDGTEGTEIPWPVVPPNPAWAWQTRETWRHGERIVMVGTRFVDSSSPTLVAFRKGDHVVAWEKDLFDADTYYSSPFDSSRRYAMSADTFYQAYLAADGSRTGAPTPRLRVQAIDLTSGDLRYRRDVVGASSAETARALTTHGDDLFLSTTRGLFVIDAKTGHTRGKLEAKP